MEEMVLEWEGPGCAVARWSESCGSLQYEGRSTDLDSSSNELLQGKF